MSRESMVRSFLACRAAGDTMDAAWQFVAVELSDMIGEYVREGLDTSRLSELQEWWANLDYRDIA